MSARELSSMATDAERATARAEAESIAARWVPAHMTARQGMVDDIARALVDAGRLERDRLGGGQCKALIAFSGGESWCCQLDVGHTGSHRWPNPADTVT